MGGFTAIVDAIFIRVTDRHAIEVLARAAAVPFIGLWLEAPVQVLLERLQHREHDASDADATVLGMQDLGNISWHKLDSSASIDAVRKTALSLFRGHVNDAPVMPLPALGAARKRSFGVLM